MVLVSNPTRALIVSLAALASLILAMMELESRHLLPAATHAFGSLALGLLAIDGGGRQRAPWLRITTLLASITFLSFVVTRVWQRI